MADGFDIPIETGAAEKALQALLKRIDKFGDNADKILDSFAKNADQSFKQTKDSAGRFESKLDSMAGVLKGFGALAIGALGVGAIKKLTGAFGEAVDAAREKEDALKGVQNALQRTGQNSATALSEVSKFADRLEDTTGLADDTALKMFTLATSFTKNKDQAMKLVEAANNLSVATGKSLESSVTALGKSLTGTLGPLDEFDPSLKTLSKSALQAGAAIDAVAASFGGAAAAQMQTFSGAVVGVENKFDDLKVSIGQLITQNPVVIELVKAFGDGLSKLGDVVNNNQDGIRSFMKDGIIAAIEGVSAFIPVIDLLVQGFGAVIKVSSATTEGILGIAKAITTFKPAAEFVKFLVQEMTRLSNVAITLYQGFLKLPESLLGMAGVDISGIGEALEGVKITIAETNQTIQQTDLSAAFGDAEASVAAFKNTSAQTFETISAGIGKTKTTLDGYVTKLKEVPSTITTTQVVAGPGGGGGGGGAAATGNGLPDSEELERTFGAALLRNLETAAATIGQGFLGGIQTGGEAGARKAVGSAASGIAQLAGAAGPVAGAIGSAIEILGQDPEAFKSMIQGFVDGIPIIIDNIVENIPVLIETLANNLGPIITSIIGAIPRIALAVIKAIPVVIRSILSQLAGGIGFQVAKLGDAGSKIKEIFQSQFNIQKGIAEKFKNFFTNLVTNQINFQKKLAEKQLEFAKKIGEFIKSQINKNIEFTKKIVEAGKNFALKIFAVFQRIKATFDGLIQRIKDSFNIGGGGGGGGIIPGMAKGGIVPKRTLYAAGGAFVPRGTDTVPSMLTPGELVVPTDLVDGLRRMVEAQNSGGGFDAGAALALLARAVDLLAQPINVTTEATVNGKVLADIILQLNRQNARLSA